MRTPDIGTAAREDRSRIDFAALRRARRERVFAEMERRNLDVCLFGREGNGRYVAGSRRLWTSNTRPYLPSTVAVRATGRVHVMTYSASVDDAPEDIPTSDVYGRSFDPQTLVGIYASIPGLADARRVGVDGLTIPMRELVGHVCPHADIVGAEEMMRGLRRVKLPAELQCIRVAIAIAESALQRAADAVRPGACGRELLALYLERMCLLGTSTFAQQGAFAPAVGGPTPPRRTDDTPLREGQSVVLSGGALWTGYEGSLARTRWCGGTATPDDRHRRRYDRCRRLMDRMVDRCRAGGTGDGLASAYEAVGEPLAPMTIAYAVGLGHEGPIAGSPLGPRFDRSQTLCPNMVVALRGWVWDDTSGYFAEEVVRVTEDDPEILTTMGHGAPGGVA